jgi:hypothetical protein
MNAHNGQQRAKAKTPCALIMTRKARVCSAAPLDKRL